MSASQPPLPPWSDVIASAAAVTPPDDTRPLTVLLEAWNAGDGAAYSAMLASAYDELRAMARKKLARESNAHTLQPTELLHEALERLLTQDMPFSNRAHFFANVSLMLRSVLVDHARARAADKRGSEADRVTFTNAHWAASDATFDLIMFDQVLTQLEQLDARAANVLHLSSFGGLEREEIATVVNISVPTVDRDLRFARAWVAEQLA